MNVKREQNTPDLIGKDNINIKTIENEKRKEIFDSIKTERQERDSLLKKSSSFGTKLKDLFGAGESIYLENKAKIIQGDTYRNTEMSHNILDRNLKEKSKIIIRETIEEPLSSIIKIYNKKKNLTQGGDSLSDLDLKVEEQKIINTFKRENVVTAFENEELRRSVTHTLKNFFDPEHNRVIYDNIERDWHDTNWSYNKAKGFPVDVASSVIEGFNKAVETQGVEQIENSSDLCKLMNEVVYVCPDSLTEDTKKNLVSFVRGNAIFLPMHHFSRIGRLIDLTAKDPDSEDFVLNVENKINLLFEQKKWSDIDFACRSRTETLSNIALSKLDIYLKKFGINLSDVQQAWGIYPGTGDSAFRNIETNMEKIINLENERPGITSTLLSDYGIREFRRYPNEVLLNQFDTKDSDIPYGLVMYTNEDHNQAFDMKEDLIKSIFDQTSGRLGIRITEFDSKYEIIKRLASLNKKYGDKNKISYLLLGAHGEEESFQVTYAESVDKSELEGRGVKRMKDFFVKNPEIILASCSTGVENGIGQKISEVYEAKVYAPKKPTSVDSININFDENNRPLFDVKYRDDVLQAYTEGLKI